MGLVPKPPIPWVIFRIPGWLWIVGVLLSAEGVILPAKGVPLSGHLEFPGCTVLQVSYWSPVSSFLSAGNVFSFGHLSFLAICQSSPGWTLEFPRTFPQDMFLDATSSRLVHWMHLLVAPFSLDGIQFVPMNFYGVHPFVLTCTFFSANFFGLAYILHYL